MVYICNTILAYFLNFLFSSLAGCFGGYDPWTPAITQRADDVITKMYKRHVPVRKSRQMYGNQQHSKTSELPYVKFNITWASAWQNLQNGVWDQRRLRSAWASVQSDQSLCCALNGQLRTQGFFKRTAKTLIRLGGCSGWSESSLRAHAIL